ncbi:MAG: PAS domain S-box protein [Chloroflexota bacterium]
MLSRFRVIIAPPARTDRYLSARVAITNAALLLAIITLLASAALIAPTSPDPPVALLVYSIVTALLGVLFVLLRFSSAMLVAGLMVASLWGIITAANALLGGLGSPVLSAYLVLVVLAALTLGTYGGVLTAVLSILTVYGLDLADDADLLPAPVHTLTADMHLVLEISHIVLTGVFVYVAARTINRYLLRARRDDYILRQNLQELQTSSVSRQYMDNIIQSMSNLLIVLDPEGRIRSANRAALDLLGYREEDLIGRRFNSTILADPGDTFDDAETYSATRLLRTPYVRNIDQTFRARNGDLIPVLLSSSVMFDSDKQVQGVVCVAQDVTERRAAAAQMAFQANLLASVSDAIIATDLSNTITSWNAAAERLYGYTAEEAIGYPITEILPTRLPNSIRLGDVRETVDREGYWSGEIIQRRKDNTPLYVLSSVALLRDTHGRPTGTVIINHDITQRRRAELTLQKRAEQLALLRQVDIEVGSTLSVERVLRLALNAGFVMTLNGEHPDSPWQVTYTMGRYLSVQRGPTERFGVLARALREHKAQLVTELYEDPDYIADLPDTVELMVLPLVSQDRLLGAINLEAAQHGQFTEETFALLQILISRIAAALDNARLYQIARDQLSEMQTLYAQVSSLEQLKTDMIRIASHDLRNPIGIAHGYLQLIKQDLNGSIPVELQDYISQIESAIQRMNEIATNILSLERIQQMANSDDHETIDLSTLVQQVTLGHVKEANERGLGLYLEHGPMVEAPIVRGDTNQLFEAITNLLTNAIKYTSVGGQINVRVLQSGSRVIVRVEDTGLGIPMDEQPRLFQPFFRAQNVNTPQYDGIGLGLHLVKNIIERHRGRVTFESTPGEGSVFNLELPLQPEI